MGHVGHQFHVSKFRVSMLAMLAMLAMLSCVFNWWPRVGYVGSCWQSKTQKRAVLLKKEAFFEFVGYAQANEYAGFKNPPLKPAWIKG